MRTNESWDDYFDQLSDFYEAKGRSNIVDGDQAPKSLADWVSSQLLKKKNGNLPQDKIELLNSLNIDWHAHGKQWSKWQRHFSKLKRYAEKTNGDPNVSQLMKGIGPWLSSQRVLYRQGLLSNSKRVLMESIGVCWNPSQRVDDRWWRQFEKLKSFKDKHGHCNVPRRELPDPGIWVSAQRTSFKKGTLKKERIDALNGIGFSWQIRKSGD
jgi:hypothetical protein